MAVFLFLVLGAMGCDDSAPPKEQLEGNWLFQAPDGFTGMGLTFNGAQYSAFVMELTTSSSANAEVETGSFLTSDTQIVFTPREWSCPGPDSIYVLPYKLANGSLAITSGATLIVFQRNVASPATTLRDHNGLYTDGELRPDAGGPRQQQLGSAATDRSETASDVISWPFVERSYAFVETMVE